MMAAKKDKIDNVIPETGPTITQIAHKISDWQSISGYFDILEPEQTAIRSENQFSVNNQRMAFIRKWRSKNGSRATYRRLAELFRLSGNEDLSELVLGCCSDGGTNTGNTPQPSSSTTHSQPQASRSSGPTIKRSDIPTLLELMAFPVEGGGENIDFTVDIGNSYKKFGVFILNDSKGTVMTALESQHSKNSEDILNDVFTKWLEGKGIDCTWENLLECLRKCRCNTLANKLEKNLA